MDLGDFIDGVLQQSRSRSDWRRLIGIVVTVLFILFSSIRRSRSATIGKEQLARGKVRLAYAPIEARGFPLWTWWGFLIATALFYLALLPHLTTLAARVLVAAAAVAGLVLLRVLGGRADVRDGSGNLPEEED